MPNKFIEQVFNWACLQDPVYRVRIATGLCIDRKLLFITGNSTKTHPLAKRFQKNDFTVSLHSELNSLVQYFRTGYEISRLNKARLFIARAVKTEDGFRKGICKPCKGCSDALLAFGVKEVYYTTDEQTVECLW